MSLSDRKKLISIKDEVNELHPILDKLLWKLPNVTTVEYTHGNREMGADFVVAQQNETFGNEEYIGVVAKVGKIHQNFSDVEKQIKECRVPRYFHGGKQKIRLDEVWVIVTGNITGGAQEKIHDEFRERKIVFVNGTRLENLIDTHMPTYWSDVSLEVGEYLTDLHIKTREKDRSTNLLATMDENFYIEQDIYERPTSEYKYSNKARLRLRKVKIFEAIKKRNIIFVEGGVGAGKSKLLSKMVDHYTDPEIFSETKILPIPIDYRNLVDTYEGKIAQFIQKRLNEKLRSELTDVNYLLLIDAVDEKNLPHDEQITVLKSVIEQIDELKNTKAVITSRYLDGIEESESLGKYVYRCELRRLSLSKTIEFIKLLCNELNISNRILEDLKKSQLFHELPRSPIVAILLAQLLNENSQELPSNLTELYTKYVELILGRWDKDKGLQSQKEYQALDNIIMQMAEHIHMNKVGFITIDEAKQIFDHYLNARNLEIERDELFSKMASRRSIVTVDDKYNRVMFKHRTFVEFFYAKNLAQNNNLTIDHRAFEMYWRNTFFFFIGIKKDCPEILETLISLSPQSKTERWSKVINIGDYFLAGFTSPYDIITDGITKTALEAAKLYIDVVERKIDSPLAEMPRMHILYLMQLLMRYGYSYSFFEQAIEDTALEISTSDESNEVKAYALFFLNVAYIDMGSQKSFDFLLESVSGGLPLDLTMALRHETQELKSRTKLMKKQDKKARLMLENMKKNRSLETTIDKLYEMPVKMLNI